MIEDTESKWRLPLNYFNGHRYMKKASTSCLFSKTDLQQMHNHFMHPSTGKLDNLLKRFFPQRTTTKIKEMLFKISKNYEQC